VGGFPPGWAEWNDKFRDNVREFWKGDASATDFVKRLCASGEIFNTQGRRPWASVNFITAHDGFTLNDVVTYNDKHNEANGEDNNDGSSNNQSWNCGVEGPTDDPEVNSLRSRQIRNMLATLLLSQGTPMLLAGDEFGRTQNGNNNAYCQDNEISWLNWDIKDKGKHLIEFVKQITAMRHKYPILRRDRFLTGDYIEELGVKDVTWINANGHEMEDKQWGDSGMRCFGMLLDGRAQTSGIRKQGKEATLLIVFNDHTDVVEFSIPECVGGDTWSLLIDTNLEDNSAAGKFKTGEKYKVTSRSVLLFALDAEGRKQSFTN
jgi:glycogen operon protein